MKIYQWILYDTDEGTFTTFTAKTKQEVDIKAWSFIVELERDCGCPIYELEYCDIKTYEDFCNTNGFWLPFINGGSLVGDLIVTEI